VVAVWRSSPVVVWGTCSENDIHTHSLEEVAMFLPAIHAGLLRFGWTTTRNITTQLYP
jgi:hypothetical protein